MTQRERQLLEWIRENPMISQQELADKAGITRSSTAVHISNLMKKGYIAGRGYLLRTAPYIVVIGGVNMDIGAVSRGELVSRDSNPGRVATSLGGVGRNIAHNLCLLGEEVSMVTVLGQDSFAQSVRENATAIGLDLTHSAVIPGGRTGTYLFIAGPDGDMELAVNDMDIYEHITPEFLRQRMDFINHADLVVTETNLPAASLQWLCQHCAAPILADPVSTIKAPKLAPVLGKLTALKPNRMEAELKETAAEMKALKARGINTLLPDYPQPYWFYTLADRTGFYVVDCAAIYAPDARDDRSVGGTPSNDPRLTDEYLGRVKAMYHRSRNHTSIIGFALGRDSGNGYNMYKAYQWLKSVEPSKPVFYVGADGEWNSDAIPFRVQ